MKSLIDIMISASFPLMCFAIVWLTAWVMGVHNISPEDFMLGVGLFMAMFIIGFVTVVKFFT